MLMSIIFCCSIYKLNKLTVVVVTKLTTYTVAH